MSISSLAADLDSIIAHAGDAVTIVGVNAFGVLLLEDITVAGETGLQVMGQQYSLIVRAGVFPGIGLDVAAVVNGQNYKIRDPGKPQTDGTQKLTLVPSSP